MNFKVILKSGDQLRILDGDCEYFTTVDDVTDESNFSILQPCHQGKMMELEPGRTYRMICVKSGGIHRFDAMVMTMATSGSVKVVNCRYTSNYIRLQRRNAFRCPMLLRTDLRKKTESGMVSRDWESYYTLDISESGMRLRLPARYTQGDIVEAILYINQYGMDLELPPLTGMIVRATSIPNRRDEVMCGVRFSNIDAKSRDILLKLVTLGQRSRIKQ